MNVTGNTTYRLCKLAVSGVAAMEPGERHREHKPTGPSAGAGVPMPQWSPVNVTGNTLPCSPWLKAWPCSRNGAR